jgi:hypothetical protein
MSITSFTHPWRPFRAAFLAGAVRRSIRFAYLITGLAIFWLTVAAGAQAASGPSTPVHLSPSQVAQTLFVAGDVGRLSQIPSGAESVAEEKVLQQLYTDNPALATSQAVMDIRGLEAALASGSDAISPATLTVMAGNERILTILRALSASNPPAEVAHALAEVTSQALTASSQSAQYLGQAFDASADSLDTLSFNSFSPGGVLSATASLASTNNLFGQARDALWKQAASESVFDSTQTLLGENTALQNSAVKTLVGMLNPDGSFDTSVGALQNLIDGGVQQIDEQNCKLASGASGTTPADCSAGALHDALLVAQACPNGSSDTSAGCQGARNQTAADATNEVSAINAEQAATAAAAAALDQADRTLGLAEQGEAQAAAQVADEENQYLNYQTTGQFEKTGFDVLTLATTLSVSEIDPVYAVSGLLSVVGDTLGFASGGPDPNTIILQGIQNISQQLSDFEQYTQSAFHAVDLQLSNLSSQVSQLSAQLTQAQNQLTQLATTLSALQSSVDRLESEVKSLFAQGARNDLATLVNQYIGYQQVNGAPLSQSQFATAAGALFQDATGTALTQTVLNVPSAFDASDANTLLNASDPLTLDSNINLFSLYGAQVSDAPPSIGWPGALTKTCAPNADHALCLPDPDFWATSARAFAQLLMENPSYVTPTRITQLNAIEQEGQLIANALHQLSVNDAGTDVSGTGNKTLDAAVNYFRYWAKPPHPDGTPPSLYQALKNAEQSWLSSQLVPGDSALSYAAIDPWQGPTQSPDLAGLTGTSSFTQVRACPTGFPAGDNPSAYILPKLTPAMIAFIDPGVLNAVRLGLGTISTCWNVAGFNPQIGPDGTATTGLNLSVLYTFHGNDGRSGEVGTISASYANAPDCAYDGNFGDAITLYEDVVDGWGLNPSRNPNCPDLTSVAGFRGAQTEEDVNDVVGHATFAVELELSTLRRNFYRYVINAGSGNSGAVLTTGTSPATNVQAAATRLAGADALLDGYISLGLPQALASDDALHSLVAGANADTFDPASGVATATFPGIAPARDVPHQVINLYQAALADDTPNLNGVVDPAQLLADLVDVRSNALVRALQPHIVGSGTQSGALAARVRLSPRIVAAAPAGAGLAEENPYIGPTLDRLSETAFVLNDELGHVAATPGTATPPASAAPASPAAANTTALATCALKATSNRVLVTPAKRKARKAAARVKPGTVSLTVKCDQAGRVKLSGTLTQLLGRKPAHGKQKSKTYRLGPVTAQVRAGRVLILTVKLPAAAVTALGHGAKESATFMAAFTAPAGGVRATTRIAVLHATR